MAIFKGLIVAGLTLAASMQAIAQGVVLQRVDQGLALVVGPSGAFGDFDDDGDMDILVSGKTAVEFPFPITRVYVGTEEVLRSPPGGGLPRWFRVFDERGTGISGVWIGAVAWFDPNRDGRLEFVVSGARNGKPPYDPQTAVYRSFANQFEAIPDDIAGLFGGSIDVGDVNNDGKEDLLLTGSTGQEYATRLYLGSGGGLFAPSQATLPGVGLSDGRFVDYDVDGDLDIFLVGDTGTGLRSHLLRNDGDSNFIEVETGIEPVVFASADWGDFDNDGDPDLLLAGARLSPFLAEGLSRVYRNDGDGVFTDVDAGLKGTYHGFARWGDMDNDGLLDIIQAGGGGVTTQERIGQIYLNQGSSQFLFAFNLTGLTISAGDLGDYDGDGDLDVMQLGQGAVILYRNEYYPGAPDGPPPPPGLPGPPSALESVVEGNAVTLSWAEGTDGQTPAAGLTYNIRVGTVPGSVDVVSPLAHPVNGRRKVSRLGNVQGNRSWTIRGLGAGTYHWSVQSIDASLSGSEFAADRSFVIQ